MGKFTSPGGETLRESGSLRWGLLGVTQIFLGKKGGPKQLWGEGQNSDIVRDMGGYPEKTNLGALCPPKV